MGFTRKAGIAGFLKSDVADPTDDDASATAALLAAGSTATVALGAGGSADSTRITVTAKNAAGITVAGVHMFTLFMSESSSGLGLTGDTYSGDLTAITGKIIGTLTSKKAWIVQTAVTGIFVGDLVDTAQPADQYAVVRKPLGPGVVVSNVSGTNWNAP